MTVDEILRSAKTIAVVGLSDNPDRPSYGVAEQLMRSGYEIIPVNPRLKEWRGIKCYPYVSSIPEGIDLDIVDIFRRSEFIPDTVKDILKRSKLPRCVWLQLGIHSEEARRMVKAKGIFFVEDLCTAVEARFAQYRASGK